MWRKKNLLIINICTTCITQTPYLHIPKMFQQFDYFPYHNEVHPKIAVEIDKFFQYLKKLISDSRLE